MKKCSHCKKNKFKKDFHFSTYTRDSFSSWCKSCKNIHDKKYRQNNLDKLRQLDKIRNYKRKYGITIEEKEQMLIKQNNQCLLCKKKLVMGRYCHLDHNHETNTIRGILCQKCNQLLGFLEFFLANQIWVKRAMSYLRLPEEIFYKSEEIGY